MKEKVLDKIKAIDAEKGNLSFDKLKNIAKENHITAKSIANAVGNPEVVTKYFKDKNNILPDRRCKVCRNVFHAPSSKREVCFNPDCIKIFKKEKEAEERKLRDFKIKVTAFLLQEIKAKKEKHSQKMKKAWENKSAEDKIKQLNGLQKGREKYQQLTKEEKQARKEVRKNNMEKKKLMKSALLQILNNTDEQTGVSNLMAMTEAVVKRVKESGDPRAATFIRDTIDEDPKKEDNMSANIVVFAAPPALADKTGEVQDAEYTEVSEKEQYERLKEKFDAKQIEAKPEINEEQLNKEINKL